MGNDNEKKSKVVQTYAEDMARVLESEKGGIIKKIIHGEERHEEEKRNLSPESRKNKFFMLLGLLLIVASLATLFFFFFKKEVPSIPAQKQFTPLVFNDKISFLEVSGLKKEEIAAKVSGEVGATTVKQGGVEGIYPTLDTSPIGLRKFMELIHGNFIPGSDFVDNNFLMGVVNSKGTPAEAGASAGKDFFMLLKVRSVPDIFGPMHAWEPKLFSDLHGFFGIAISPDTGYLLTKDFEDGIVENKNARILYDKEKNPVLMYIFADDTSVIITNAESAARELMLRLASSRIKK